MTVNSVILLVPFHSLVSNCNSTVSYFSQFSATTLINCRAVNLKPQYQHTCFNRTSCRLDVMVSKRSLMLAIRNERRAGGEISKACFRSNYNFSINLRCSVMSKPKNCVQVQVGTPFLWLPRKWKESAICYFFQRLWWLRYANRIRVLYYYCF